MNKGLDFKDELTKNDFRYISLVWVSVNQFFLVLLSKYLLSPHECLASREALALTHQRALFKHHSALTSASRIPTSVLNSSVSSPVHSPQCLDVLLALRTDSRSLSTAIFFIMQHN